MSGIYLDEEGKYKNIDNDEELTVLDLNHSEYGLIKYVIVDSVNYPVSWSLIDDSPDLPEDWVEEI